MFSLFKKRNIKDFGENNQINLIGVSKKNFTSENILKIEGNNNCILLDNCRKFRKSRIKITGNNNNIKISEGTLGNLVLFIEADNCLVEIGKNVWFNGTEIHLRDNNSRVIIGDETIIALETSFFCSDFHAIIDKTGRPINQGKEIIIGKHCWICKWAKILKNVHIADNTIVGAASIVSQNCDEKNVIIAGNPAKIIRREVNWVKSKYDEQEKIYLNNQRTHKHD